jgi:hypothetical protein
VRFLIHLADGADVDALRRALHGTDVTDLTPPRAELPDIAIAVAPDDADVTALMAHIRSMPGVVHVEPDALSGTL